MRRCYAPSCEQPDGHFGGGGRGADSVSSCVAEPTIATLTPTATCFDRRLTTSSRAGREMGEQMAGPPIVVGTDGSATASKAVEKAGELAAALGVPLPVGTT